MFLNALIVKGRPKFFSLITILFIGFSVDFWLMFLLKNVEFDLFLHQVLSLIGGILILAVGVAMYLQTQFAVNPIDQLMISLNERFRLSYMTAKTIGELSALILAFALQGPIGIGTLIITFFIGPIIELINKPMTKRYEILIKR
jgi:uncharacterized membrane protein YczE